MTEEMSIKEMEKIATRCVVSALQHAYWKDEIDSTSNIPLNAFSRGRILKIIKYKVGMINQDLVNILNRRE